MKEYRIAELSQNRFRIEVKVVDEIKTGFLWWRKTEIKERWSLIDINGNVMIYSPLIHGQIVMPYFKTFKEAMEKINELNYICKYHYLNKENNGKA